MYPSLQALVDVDSHINSIHPEPWRHVIIYFSVASHYHEAVIMTLSPVYCAVHPARYAEASINWS